METKEQSLKEIKILNDKINNLKAHINRLDGIWKPKFNEEYYFIGSYAKIRSCPWLDRVIDNERYSYGNCFKEANDVASKLEYDKVHQQLKEIAYELNNGFEIDLKKEDQTKYFLFYDFSSIKMGWNTNTSYGNTVYCLAATFRDIALERIGKDKLIQYLTYSEQ